MSAVGSLREVILPGSGQQDTGGEQKGCSRGLGCGDWFSQALVVLDLMV